MSNLNNAASSGRIGQVDTLKGIAIAFVLLSHSVIKFPINLHENEACDFLSVFVSSVHMPMFFLLSGFCYSYSGDYRLFITRKVKRILIPYFVFNFVSVLPRAVLPSLVNKTRGISESLVRIFFYGGDYWFLYVLFIIFAVYPWVDKLLNRSAVLKIMLPISLPVLYCFSPGVEFLKLSSIEEHLIYFILGRYYKKADSINRLKISLLIVF